MASFNEIIGRGAGIMRGGLGQGQRIARFGFDRAGGLARRVTNRGSVKDLDDVTLARKVETEIFRGEGAPKGKVDVNVQEGVVQLRGEVDAMEMIDDLVGKARKVQGVREVENLLHLPGTPPPMHQ